MKKALAFIWLLTYFTVSTGFTVNLHYCMDRLDSFELGGKESDTCGKCGMHVEDSGGCCRDEVKVIKLELDESPAQAAAFYFVSAPAILTEPVLTERFLEPVIPSYTEPIHGPPLLSGHDRYLRHCVFRL
ncbi:MAG TPA: hypothetical protein VHK69_07575 [Chitinophagaceae bacterium]|jgi:hypothetical protein|nr:hypothetical protein [Chitinophagaceae bacterium]